MKKIVAILAIFSIGMNLWAINPPSYVGRNIQEVLREIEGVKVHYIRPMDGDEVYKIFITDTEIISFYITSDKITSASCFRIYYSSSTLGNTINGYLMDDIMERLIMNHTDALGNPKRNSMYAKWSGERVGQYFMNSNIKSYLISKTSLLLD